MSLKNDVSYFLRNIENNLVVTYILSIYNIDMIYFEWDERKNNLNRKKHGIWFEEGQQVFDDPNAILYHDKDHSYHENRFILLGMSSNSNLLVVVHCERNQGDLIRIISVRRATKKEKTSYEKGI